MRELLCNNSLFVGQLYEDKSLALRARDLIFFTTDLHTVNYCTLNSIFVEIQPNSTYIKNDPRIKLDPSRLDDGYTKAKFLQVSQQLSHLHV